MENISAQMKSLCEDIITSHTGRREALKDLKRKARAIRTDARRFLSEVRSDLEEAAKHWKKIAKTKEAKITK